MTAEQQQAFEWAKNQNYPSVAARYAKILANLISDQNEQIKNLTEQAEKTEKERDAAYKIMHGDCSLCAYNNVGINDEPCISCDGGSNWKLCDSNQKEDMTK